MELYLAQSQTEMTQTMLSNVCVCVGWNYGYFSICEKKYFSDREITSEKSRNHQYV